jgi:RNA recognition motif-containing protein
MKTHAHPTVFVARLSRTCDESELREFFSRCCQVRGAWVVREKETGESRNYGFVEVESPDDLGVALSLDNASSGRQLGVGMANK